MARYTLAVDRRVKRDGEPQADFLHIVAFGKAGEHVEKYFHKGTQVAVTGRIVTGSFTNREGQKVPTFEIIAEEQEFTGSKPSGGSNSADSGGYGGGRGDYTAGGGEEYGGGYGGGQWR